MVGFSSLLIVHAVCLQCGSHSACNVEARRLLDAELTMTTVHQTTEGAPCQKTCIISASSPLFLMHPYVIHEMKQLCSALKKICSCAEVKSQAFNKVLSEAPCFSVIMPCSKLALEVKKCQSSTKEADDCYCNQEKGALISDTELCSATLFSFN